MRPLRLELQGFTTFRDTTVIDFDDVDLVAFVGPTGSGKSSLIDAITFALYGSVSRYGDDRLVQPVINELGNEARVRLDFTLADATFTAVRVVRRTKTGATTREARLERTGADGSTEVVAGSAAELSESVRTLLGLDFGQFTRTVVLPQGEFARFLTDSPADRQRLLRQLLDLGIYERLGQNARRLAKERQVEAETIAGLIADRGDDAEERAWLVERSAALLVAVDVADGLAVEVEQLDADVAARREQYGRLDRLVSRLGAITEPDGSGEMGDRRRAAADARAAASERLAAIDVELAEIDRTVAGVDEGALQQRVTASSRLDLQQVAVDEDRAALAGLAERLEASGAALAEAEAALAGADLAVAEARRHAGAAAVADGLSPGDDCPVCGQVIGLVAASGDGGLDDALAARDAADRALRSARMERNDVEREHAVRSAAASDRSSRLAATRAELADGPSLVESERLLAEVREARASRSAAVERRRGATDEIAAADATLGRIDAELSAARSAYSDTRDGVVELEPPSPTDDVTADWAALVAWAATRRPSLEAERAEDLEAGRAAAAEATARRAELDAVVAPFELESGARDVVAALRAELARVEQRQIALDEQKVETERLEARRADADRERRVQSQLGQHLSARGFERWLLSEAIDDLTARATERLHELSGGQYSLAADGTSFQVIDHGNADNRRDVRTLSGGETFLASLALALALADSVAELAPVDAPRLDSMFLDEGFGTLDPETLDVVATAIEELASTGRLVGVVTHVRDLAERLPARFEVVKRSTGSTVTKVVT